ncbi:MAG: bifunctional phosphoribosylaminoimidazolecarboxamide formyltransferase/IMP cyclohydrolase, partial [Actinobacteria bacterium]|nr:bifunctional phosphoribosylaminoimidazolecarboxamide formyltransferase/IMP cyclohydrolase [Actinomycetota bacterium]
MTDAVPVRVALLSVANKEGLVPFARRLRGAGVRIVSSGSTAAALRAEGVEATAVA